MYISCCFHFSCYNITTNRGGKQIFIFYIVIEICYGSIRSVKSIKSRVSLRTEFIGSWAAVDKAPAGSNDLIDLMDFTD